jgi:hypothetical protein
LLFREEKAMTEAERIFIERMVPHVEAGKSFDEAARAVLEDDERLWLAATAKDDQGEFIRENLANKVYGVLRGRTN